MREYFKTASISEEIKEFRNFCKKNGADFIEGEGNSLKGIWIIPKKYGDARIAIGLREQTGYTDIGKMNESCQNFEDGGRKGLVKEELVWLRSIFEKLEKWNPKDSSGAK